jgi:tetratricopeptide (TPR) repeat protein
METEGNELIDFDRLWNFARPDETEARFRELVPKSEGNTSYHVELLTQIARTQGLQRKFDEAHRTLDSAEEMLTPDMARPQIRLLLERGRVLNSAGDPDGARPHFLAAWEHGLKSGQDNLAVDAAHMIAIVEPPERQHEWNLRALELVERSEDPQAKKWSGSLYQNIGWTYHKNGQFDMALESFRKAEAWRVEHGSPAALRIARWCVARALRSLDRIDEALGMQQDLQREFAGIGEEDGYVYEEIAECLQLLNRPDEAVPFFAMAHAKLSADKWLIESEPARIARLGELGRVEQTHERDAGRAMPTT